MSPLQAVDQEGLMEPREVGTVYPLLLVCLPQGVGEAIMTSYRRAFLGNAFATVLLILLSGYQMALQVAQSETSNPFTYAGWIFIWVVSCSVGVELIKIVWAYEKDQWLEAQMPPLFLEGAV